MRPTRCRSGRRHFKHRRLIVGGDHVAIIDAIANKDATLMGTRELHEAAPGVVFMFPGQGSQYVNMGRDLCASETVFKQHFDHCCELFSKELGYDLRAILHPVTGKEDEAGGAAQADRSTRSLRSSPSTIRWARLWMHGGIKP
jgi:acyl transferase domain-containing protein